MIAQTKTFLSVPELLDAIALLKCYGFKSRVKGGRASIRIYSNSRRHIFYDFYFLTGWIEKMDMSKSKPEATSVRKVRDLEDCIFLIKRFGG